MSRGALIGCVLGFGLALASALGCNTIVGIHDPIENGTPGSSGTPPTSPSPDGGPPVGGVASFVGSWSTNASTQSLMNCSGATQPATLMNEPAALTITAGTNGSVIAVPVGTDCQIVSAVSGSTATVAEGQACTVTLMQGGTATYNYGSTSTFVLDASGTSALGHFVAVVEVMPSGETCEYEETSPFVKQ